LNLHAVTVRATVTPFWKFAPTVPVLKGIGSLDEYLFLKAYKIKTVLSVHVRWFIVFLACLVQEENTYKVSVWIFENTYKSKNCSVSAA
jgi:hypothetical protein